MIDFTSRQLRAFLLVAEHRSFARAAGALFITPAGLSILIRELETQLGTRLFDRTTRHVDLTASGAELLVVAQRNLQELDGVLSRVGQSVADLGSSFSMGAPPLVAASILAPAIKQFRSHRPDFRFQLFDGDSTTTMQKVEAGALDMGMGVFFKHLPGVRRRSLFRFFLTVISADSGDTSRRSSIRWSALKGKKLVSLHPTLPFQQFVGKRLARAGIEYRPALVVNFISTQIAMVEAGEGLAIVPSFWNFEGGHRKLAMSRLVDPVVYLDFCQIQRGGRKLPHIAEEFTSFLQDFIAKSVARPGLPGIEMTTRLPIENH